MRSSTFATRAVRLVEAGLACMAVLVGAASLRAQSAPTASPAPLAAYRHRILGVYGSDTGAPLDGVIVTDILSGTKAVTTSTGTATLAFLPDGGSVIRIAKLGYETQTFLAAISPKDTAPITIVLLHSTATMLPTVVSRDTTLHYISPALQGFEERRALGFGHFISEAELRKSDDLFLPDVLERIPGIRLVWNWQMRATYIASGRNMANANVGSFQAGPGSPCFVAVSIDGARIWDANIGSHTPPPDFSQFSVKQYAGIEFYAGGATMPAQFNGTGSPCGTLLLWTRER